MSSPLIDSSLPITGRQFYSSNVRNQRGKFEISNMIGLNFIFLGVES